MKKKGCQHKYLKNSKKNKYELFFLEYHLEHYNAKYIKGFCNNHFVFHTKVVLYGGTKRKLKYQPISNEITLCGMFSELKENTFYSIPQLIEKYKE